MWRELTDRLKALLAHEEHVALVFEVERVAEGVLLEVVGRQVRGEQQRHLKQTKH